jgi:hypothetical protein
MERNWRNPVSAPINRDSIAAVVNDALRAAPLVDIHTHLYPPEFGRLLLWGIDELLTYHYLVAEAFRVADDNLDYDRFWALPKPRQADWVWDHLFLRRSPLSEACRGVITCLQALGLDPAERDLNRWRAHFAQARLDDHLGRVLDLSGVRTLVMTNDPFDDDERPLWLAGAGCDSRFKTALRLDRLLIFWDQAAPALATWGYQVAPDLLSKTVSEVRRFLTDWIARLRPLYLAASLPPEFAYPHDSVTNRLLDECVLPVAADHGLPFALMIGCRRQINPRLRLAGDGVGRADLAAVSNLCALHPQNRFLCTALSRENQHELAVIARKFRNLHIFGCWWFVNTPSLIDEITRLRLELLGLSFTPQHSDARVLEQLIYKWEHSRTVLARVLTDQYVALASAGRSASPAEIQRDVGELLGGAALRFVDK